MVRSFLIAWHFLLSIPLSRAYCRPAAGELAASMAWFPLVGLAVGALLVAADLLLSRLFQAGVVDLLLVIVLVLLTRGLHLDGLADTFDGLVGGRTPAQRLEIMRDPRIGAMGAMALVLLVGLRYAALGALPPELRSAILLAMPMLGRWGMVLATHGAPYARPDGLGQPFLARRSPVELGAASTVVTVGLVALFGVSPGVMLLMVGVALAAIWALLCRRWFGGVTGDTLGALNEVVEVAVLLIGPFVHVLR